MLKFNAELVLLGCRDKKLENGVPRQRLHTVLVGVKVGGSGK
jgi:hypothetical protein